MDTDGGGDLFVAGAGTAAGVGEYLKAQNPAVRVAAVEPADSLVFSGGVCRKGGAAQLRPFSHTGSHARCRLQSTRAAVKNILQGDAVEIFVDDAV